MVVMWQFSASDDATSVRRMKPELGVTQVTFITQ